MYETVDCTVPILVFQLYDGRYVLLAAGEQIEAAAVKDMVGGKALTEPRLFIGPADCMREWRVQSGCLLDLDGESVLRADASVLFLPERNKGGTATWNGLKLKELSASDFVLCKKAQEVTGRLVLKAGDRAC
jgi:hypothetical protein